MWKGDFALKVNFFFFFVLLFVTHLQLSQGNDVAVGRSMPHSLLGSCIVIVKTRCALIKKFPPLIVVSFLPVKEKKI